MARKTVTKKEAHANKRSYQAERGKAIIAAGQEIGELPFVENPERKIRSAKEFRFFCETYFPKVFYSAWSDDHLRVIAKIQRAILTGGQFALAMPRGSGKTSLCKAAVIWAMLCGHCRFIILIAATCPKAKKILTGIKTTLETNKKLLADYPEVCYPIRKLNRSAHACGGQKHLGEHTRISWTAEELVLPTINESPASGGVIHVVGMTGAVRGDVYTQPDGMEIRPDFALVDDPQTRESAHSTQQTDDRMDMIASDVLGLAGPDASISVVMPCTVIAENDLADQLLNREKHPSWRGERTKMIYEFPTDKKLWQEYEEIQRIDFMNDGDNTQATKFYKKNRKAMDMGAVIAWPSRFRKKKNEISAIQCAMNLKIENADVFQAEYQNEPVPEKEEGSIISAADIASKTNGLGRGVIPIGCNHLTMMIDVHKRFLFWLIAAWEDDFTGYIIDYGVWPDQKEIARGGYFTKSQMKYTMQQQKSKAGFEGYLTHGLEQLTNEKLNKVYFRDGGMEMKIGRCMIDANWGESKDAVYAFCRRSENSRVLLPSHGHFYGASSTPFSEYKKKKGDRVGHHWRQPNPTGKAQVRYVYFDTNYWKSVIHHRLATAIGDKGCLSLFGRDAKTHAMIADHFTAEYRLEVTARGRTVDEWKWRMSRPDNDWFDCVVGCAVAASISGALIGVEHRVKKKKKFVSNAEKRQQAQARRSG